MAQSWMDIAWKQEGQKEVSGAVANPEIVAYFREAGHPEVHSDEVSWCAAFACACLERAGIKSPRTLLAREFLSFGTPVDTARVGAIAVFSRPPGAVHGHVGFVAGETADAIVLLGGNQADAVSIIHMPKERLLGYRWPAEARTAADLKAQGSRIIAHADGAIRSKALAGGAAATALSGTQLQDHAAAITQAASTASQVKGAASTLMDAWAFAQHAWIWLAAMLALYFGGKAIWHAYQVKAARTEDANTGAHAGLTPAAPAAIASEPTLIGGPDAG